MRLIETTLSYPGVEVTVHLLGDGMTIKHLAWCLMHDWGTHAVLNNDGSISNVTESFSDGSKESHTFYDYESLREWAGY